jgi:NAD-dependent dihydropyrimidine dehydrogenase PreA subunit
VRIDKDLCVDCGTCVPYCPVGALYTNDRGEVMINDDLCVECHICYYSEVCPTGALNMNELEYPRLIRAAFSDVKIPHANTGIGGRGTEEMKTNDVTGRFKPGYAGVAIEFGRPGVATTFRDVEKLTMALTKNGCEFEKENPLDPLIADRATGKMKEECLNERALSAIIEFAVPLEKLEEVLRCVMDTAPTLDTVFSLDVATVVGEDGSFPTDAILSKLGLTRKLNGKTCVGLGRRGV